MCLLCCLVKLLICRKHWGSWSELWVCFTGCARICMHVIRTCAHTDAQMLEFQGAYERCSLGASVDERSTFKWLQWFCKSHISKDLQVCLQVCLPHLILMQKAVWCAHWCSVCPMGENALSRANFSFIFRDIKNMNRASLFKWVRWYQSSGANDYLWNPTEKDLQALGPHILNTWQEAKQDVPLVLLPSHTSQFLPRSSRGVPG